MLSQDQLDSAIFVPLLADVSVIQVQVDDPQCKDQSVIRRFEGDMKDVGCRIQMIKGQKKTVNDNKKVRHWQDSNLRGRSPVAFKAIPLTTLAQCRYSLRRENIYNISVALTLPNALFIVLLFVLRIHKYQQAGACTCTQVTVCTNTVFMCEYTSYQALVNQNYEYCIIIID